MSGATDDKYASLPEREPHDVVKAKILDALIPYVFGKLHGLAVRGDEMAYVVTGHNTLVPALSVVQQNRLSSPKQKSVEGAPDLAIEVVSPTDLEVDLKRKIEAYMTHGCKSVWVVYPEARSVVVRTQDSIREFKAGQNIEDPVLPGFSAPVASFFEIS